METNKKDEAIMRLSLAVICLTFLVLVLLGILLWFYFSSNKQKGNEVGWCGVVSEKPLSCGNAVCLPHDVSSKDYDNGRKVFMQNCAVCHSIGSNLITGPGLKNISNRVPSIDWLSSYISNSDSLLNKKDAYALKLHNEYPESNEFKHLFKETLTFQEIKNLINYLEFTKGF